MRKLYTLCAAAVLLALFVGGATTAKADTFNWSTADFLVKNIGNDGTQGTEFDQLGFTGAANSFLLSGVGSKAEHVLLGTMSFIAGASCYSCTGDTGTAMLSMTINGTVQSFVLPWIATITNARDSINLASQVFTFMIDGQTLKLTTDAVSLSSTGATDNANLYGTFELMATPEPASLLLFGTGLTGLAGFLRKRFARN